MCSRFALNGMPQKPADLFRLSGAPMAFAGLWVSVPDDAGLTESLSAAA